MKKKKVSLAILGVASLFATTPVKAQTFWQCMPEGCDAGEYLSGFRCKSCTHEDWCPGKTEKELNIGVDNVRKRILDNANTKAARPGNACLTVAKEIITYMTNNATATYFKDVIPALKNLKIKINYHGDWHLYTSTTVCQSAIPTLKKDLDIYNTLPTNMWFEYNCLDLPVYSNGKEDGTVSRDVTDFLLKQSTLDYALKTQGTVITLNYSSDNQQSKILSPGIYKVEVAGGGGGGGGRSNYCKNRDTNENIHGKPGGTDTIIFVQLQDSVTYNYTIGKGGTGGEGGGGGDACNEYWKNGNCGTNGTDTTFYYQNNRSITGYGGRGGSGMHSTGCSNGKWCQWHNSGDNTTPTYTNSTTANNGGTGKTSGNTGGGSKGGDGYIKIWQL